MAEPRRADLLELIDWLWTERHDAQRAVRPNVPVHETPLDGWTLEAALAERARSTDERERASIEAFLASRAQGDSSRDWPKWDDLTEEERNRWRRVAGAPQYQQTPPRPSPR